MIDESTARRIASEWHAGQTCPLYAFSSSGHVEPMTADETSDTLWTAERELSRQDAHAAAGRPHPDPDALEDLSRLVAYLRGRVALDYLTRDGNLSVPCSRYGFDTESCAPVAVRVAEIIAHETGEDFPDPDVLEHVMGLVVNDHDDPESLIREHGRPEDAELLA